MTTKTNGEGENSNKRLLLMASIVVLLIISAIQLYLHNQSRKEIAEQTVVITNQSAEIQVYKYKVDSITHELEDRQRELAKLGADTTALGQLVRTLKKEKKGLSNNLAQVQAKYNALKSQFDEILASKDKEISTLRDERDNLFQENNTLKRKQVSLSDSLSQLNSTKDELSKQVAQAAVLKAVNVKITFIRKDKELDDVEYKAKKLEKVKINFDLLENKVAKIESKKVYMRLIEPDGAALYDLAMGGGSIKIDGADTYYTAMQEVLYEQSTKNVSFIYTKGSPYKVGRHTIELYCEDKMIGKGSFNLK